MSITNEIYSLYYEDYGAHDCLEKNSCEEDMENNKASFSLRNTATPHLLLDCDRCPDKRKSKRCDYIFFSDGPGGWDGVASPIEMTSGRKEISEVVMQLRAGARIIEAICPRGYKLRFVPIFVGELKTSRRQSFMDLRKDPESMIPFEGNNKRMIVISNGDEIAKAFNKAGS